MVCRRRGRGGTRASVQVLYALLAAGAALLFMGEHGARRLYAAAYWSWPDLTARTTTREPTSTMLRVLFLSDPHIQCTLDRYEYGPARWDSDRYLRGSYGAISGYLNPHPDIVVILGDVFAEGFKATESEWQDYLQCLEDVFPVPEGAELLVVAGDNDIGGEGADAMSTIVNRRYAGEFGPMNSVKTIGHISFIKLNTVALIHSSPFGAEEREARREMDLFLSTQHQRLSDTSSSSPSPPPLTILLSHVPLNQLQHHHRSTILKHLAPHFIFSGHIHHQDHQVHEVKGQRVVEYTVPTCSYRMGEAHMGLGAAAIGPSSDEVVYQVLWLPPRYPFLLLYLFWALALLAWLLCFLLGNTKLLHR